MTVGDIIRNYREGHKLSQRQFAIKCGISNGYISMLEKGINPKTGEPIMPSIGALKIIASGMNISLNDLLVQADDMPVDLSDAFELRPLTYESNGDELTEYLESLRTRPEMRMLFSVAEGATKEDVEQAVAIIEAIRNTRRNG